MRIEDQMKMHEMYANYHIAMATTGVAKMRNIKQGVEGGGWRQLTDEEKVKNALDTALNHIHRYTECAEHESRLES